MLYPLMAKRLGAQGKEAMKHAAAEHAKIERDLVTALEQRKAGRRPQQPPLPPASLAQCRVCCLLSSPSVNSAACHPGRDSCIPPWLVPAWLSAVCTQLAGTGRVVGGVRLTALPALAAPPPAVWQRGAGDHPEGGDGGVHPPHGGGGG